MLIESFDNLCILIERECFTLHALFLHGNKLSDFASRIKFYDMKTSFFLFNYSKCNLLLSIFNKLNLIVFHLKEFISLIRKLVFWKAWKKNLIKLNFTLRIVKSEIYFQKRQSSHIHHYVTERFRFLSNVTHRSPTINIVIHRYLNVIYCYPLLLTVYSSLLTVTGREKPLLNVTSALLNVP